MISLLLAQGLASKILVFQHNHCCLNLNKKMYCFTHTISNIKTHDAVF